MYGNYSHFMKFPTGFGGKDLTWASRCEWEPVGERGRDNVAWNWKAGMYVHKHVQCVYRVFRGCLSVQKREWSQGGGMFAYQKKGLGVF